MVGVRAVVTGYCMCPVVHREHPHAVCPSYALFMDEESEL